MATVSTSAMASAVRPALRALSISRATSASEAGSASALSTSDGFVVQSTGLYVLTAATSPVSATTVVIARS